MVDRNGLWEKDFHLEMTRLAGRIAGADAATAEQIAASTHAVDTASATRPVTLDLSVREGFHFASNSRLSELRSIAAEGPLSDLGEGRTPIGDYLHALQDSFSHQFGNQRFKNSHYPGPSASFDPRVGFTLFGPDFDNTSLRPTVALSAFIVTVQSISALLGTEPVLGTGDYQDLVYRALSAQKESEERERLIEELIKLLGGV